MAAQGMPNVLLYLAKVLRVQLEDLLSGTTEAPGLRTTLEFASRHILASQNALSKNTSSASTSVALVDRRPRRRLHGHLSSEDLVSTKLWKALPPQLLPLIFARLPLPQMKRLRLLSREWKRSIDTTGSEFRKRWEEACTSRQSEEVRLTVWNPTTADEDELISCLSHIRAYPRAVKFFVDRETKHYKVMVVGTYRNNLDQDVTLATVYHSRTQIWSSFEDSSNIVLGCSHCCVRGRLGGPKIPNGSWIYDAANGKYGQDGKLGHHRIGAFYTSGRTKVMVIGSAVTNDHAFQLEKVEGMQGYHILEYFYHARVITMAKYHSCSPLEKLPEAEYTLKLHSCQGFLMVSAFPKSLSSSYQQRHWFCNLSSGEWRELPALSEDKIFAADDVLCELQWSIIPKGGRVPSSTRGPWIYR